MRFLLTVILILSAVGAEGCIRHSNQPIKRVMRNRIMENKSNFRKLTPNLMVSDVNKTVEFYKKAFNFDIVATVPDTGVYNFAIVVSGKTELMFQKKESFEEDFGIRDNSQAGGTFSLYIEVTNILMVYDKAVLSANVIKELHQTFYGTKEFSVRDDNGYILTFAETLKK